MTGESRIWMALGIAAFGTGAFGSDAISHMRSHGDSGSGTNAVAGVPVRFAEGAVHGFLELSRDDGTLLAHGDLLQISRNEEISSRMVFYLPSGSVFDESVTFTQQGAFTMQSYHLVQSGPAFGDDIDATLTKSGKYIVRAKSHKDSRDHEYSGTLDMPGDVYNGMVSTIAKNISTSEPTVVHIVIFTPEPRVVAIELTPTGTQRMNLGKHEETAVDFIVKPKLGFVLNLAAKLARKLPPDTHIWIVGDGVPAFVRSAGPLYSGPVWRISLTAPTWPKL
jgi:hypothetical protein